MKKLALLAAVAVLGAGAASAQTVASTGHAGLDPASGKAPTQAVIMFHGFGQKGENMKPIAEDLAKRLPNAVFIFDNAPATQGQGFSWYNLRAEDPEGRAKAKGIATGLVKTAQDTWKIKPENIVTVGFSQGGVGCGPLLRAGREGGGFARWRARVDVRQACRRQGRQHPDRSQRQRRDGEGRPYRGVRGCGEEGGLYF
jgi:poly(3-hydroxybutyrate) depolymerase